MSNATMPKLFTVLLSLTALVNPAQAGIHDFDPARPARPAVATQSGRDGNCYTTRDQSKICYFTISPMRYSVAITDVNKPQYPSTMLVDCKLGKYFAYGNLTDRELKAYTRAICNDNA